MATGDLSFINTYSTHFLARVSKVNLPPPSPKFMGLTDSFALTINTNRLYFLAIQDCKITSTPGYISVKKASNYIAYEYSFI